MIIGKRKTYRLRIRTNICKHIVYGEGQTQFCIISLVCDDIKRVSRPSSATECHMRWLPSNIEELIENLFEISNIVFTHLPNSYWKEKTLIAHQHFYKKKYSVINVRTLSHFIPLETMLKYFARFMHSNHQEVNGSECVCVLCWSWALVFFSRFTAHLASLIFR